MQPSRSNRFVPIVMTCFVLAIFACVAYWAWYSPAGYFGDPEQRAINRTRAANLARASLNLRLAGTPDLESLETRLASHALTLGAPILMRIFKREFELELWLLRDGRYHRFATYPICRWSGKLGPKIATGDKQAPEGFYTVTAAQMNPNSRWHRSFNVGFPNAYDAAHGRTGSALMVHGGCSSAGCYAMTNAVIDEIWKLTTAALASGKQKRFQVQVYPFRLNDESLAIHASSPHIGFWRQLKAGNDLFETNWLPPAVGVCQGTYRFKAGKSPDVTPLQAANCTQRDVNNIGR
ncbi:MAG: murein L,D-transpeptidase family protein [Hyphomicrobiaceae bacterium]